MPQELAIAILEKHDIDAAHWWRNQGFLLPGCDFSIQLDEAKVVGRLKNIVLKEVRQFVGLLEVGVGAHDYPANN